MTAPPTRCRVACPPENAIVPSQDLARPLRSTPRDLLRQQDASIHQRADDPNPPSSHEFVVIAQRSLHFGEYLAHGSGAVTASDETGNLSFPFAYLIHYISTFTTLNPGDVISTGTPRGAGIHQEPPVFLQPGDVVEVEGAGLGLLRNGVIDDPTA